MLDMETILKLLKASVFLVLVGIPGTAYYLLLRRKHDREYFRGEQMMEFISPSIWAMIAGGTGAIVFGLLLLITAVGSRIG